ncbi:MAG: hypothetical protein JKX95_05330 [Bacteroidia bacterium]|nr:hypothetical protein [Bacteroidia bacterium]
MNDLIKIVILIGFSGVKFAMAFPYAFALSLSFIEIFFYTSLGGVLGVIFFSNFSEFIINTWVKLFPQKKKKRVITKKNKLVVKTWKKYGLPGIALLTPILLSIPIGTFIVVRYKEPKKRIYLFMTVAVVFWSLVLSTLTNLFEIAVF